MVRGQSDFYFGAERKLLMTIPHLMNCSHIADGWCLDCVKALYDKLKSRVPVRCKVCDSFVEYDSPRLDVCCVCCDRIVNRYGISMDGENVCDEPVDGDPEFYK